ncbi:hypothetical protein I350_00371 [Cryptococcus amylolentus CBS 6273]|nr:hypothetical protein I350_00371 [Cryptococcus amylolentus CBS 6273]
MSFRASLLRARVPTAPLARSPLSTFARPPAPSLKASAALARGPLLSRSFATSPVSRLEVSQPLGDGGTEEAPHSGINVDRSVRMDT